MAARVQVRSTVKQARKRLRVSEEDKEDADAFSLFEATSGLGDKVNLRLAVPKFQALLRQSGRFVRVLELFADTALLKGRHAAVAAELARYAAALRRQHADAFGAPASVLAFYDAEEEKRRGAAAALAAIAVAERKLQAPPPEDERDAYLAWWRASAAPFLARQGAPAPALDKPAADDCKRFAELHRGAATCAVVATALAACQLLMPHRAALRPELPAAADAALPDKFLRDVGLSLAPLPAQPALNFKQLYNDRDLDQAGRRLVFGTLRRLFATAHDVYDAVCMPDVDPSALARLVRENVGELQRQLPRCKEAIEKIRESSELMETNFPRYYKDFIATNRDSSVVMQAYVQDVQGSHKPTPQLLQQYRQIMRLYQSKREVVAQVPQLKGVLSVIGRNLSAGGEEEGGGGGGGGGGPAADAALVAVARAEKKVDEEEAKAQDAAKLSAMVAEGKVELKAVAGAAAADAALAPDARAPAGASKKRNARRRAAEKAKAASASVVVLGAGGAVAVKAASAEHAVEAVALIASAGSVGLADVLDESEE